MFRALVLGAVIAATLGGTAVSQPRYWHRHEMWQRHMAWRHHHMMMRRCRWGWHRGHRVRVCWRGWR